jgi:AraC-like DNA-binding protein
MREKVAATVRVGNVRSIPAVFASLGIDIDPLLASVGLSREIFDQPDAFVPYVSIDKVLRRGVDASGCEHLGLLVGTAPAELGLPAFLLFNAPTVRVGLTDMTSSLRHVDNGGSVFLNENGGVATISYSVVANGAECVDQISDMSLAVAYGLLTRLLGQRFQPIEIRFPRRTPVDITPYRAFYRRGHLRFDALEASIDFPADLLDLPIPNADPALYRFLKNIAARDRGAVQGSIADQIRRILPGLIRRDEVHKDVIARMFGMHSRTMARRLAEERITLHALVDEARFEVAQQLLRDTALGVTEIAAELYYADASAFTRAFRRKFGTPPGEWRRSQGARP